MYKISKEYKALNEELHKDDPDYGTSSLHWLNHIKDIIIRTGAKTILDYGCGKGLLKYGLRGLNLSVQNYDPCVPEYSTKPSDSFDLVICTDVMEHVEKDCVNCVLEELLNFTQKNIFFVISTARGNKLLSDGSNTHRSVHTVDWWSRKISRIFDPFEISISSIKDDDGNITSCVSILAKPGGKKNG